MTVRQCLTHQIFSPSTSRRIPSQTPTSATTAVFLLWLSCNHRNVVYNLYAAASQPISSSPRAHHYLSQRKSRAVTGSNVCCSVLQQRQHRNKKRMSQWNAFSSDSCPTRSGNTPADDYFRKFSQLPEPAVKHAVLLPNKQSQNGSGSTSGERRSGMLVIGDVHGCCDELILLHEKSVFENGGRQFHYVIAVGDLVNKGPKSMDVVRHFIQMSDYGWLSVRGNHDNGALLAALGDPAQSIKKKHLWMRDNPLSDEQITWMAELPYTIRIPGSLLNEHAVADTVIVHAALVPGLELEKQTVETMVNLRELEANSNDSHDDGESISAGVLTRVPWASLWKGPEHVIFGHDAKRGLQEYELATGLDTGAVYGKKMTGIILPQRKLVQVNALETHCHTDRVD